jgi:hypothetical protein
MTVRSTAALRIGIVEDGRLVEERTLSSAERVTIGQSGHCDLCLPTPWTKREEFVLFQPAAAGLAIVLDPGMQGRIALQGEEMRPIQTLVNSPAAIHKPEGWLVPIDVGARGRIDLGPRYALLFKLGRVDVQHSGLWTVLRPTWRPEKRIILTAGVLATLVLGAVAGWGLLEAPGPGLDAGAQPSPILPDAGT